MDPQRHSERHERLVQIRTSHRFPKLCLRAWLPYALRDPAPPLRYFSNARNNCSRSNSRNNCSRCSARVEMVCTARSRAALFMEPTPPLINRGLDGACSALSSGAGVSLITPPRTYKPEPTDAFLVALNNCNVARPKQMMTATPTSPTEVT